MQTNTTNEVQAVDYKRTVSVREAARKKPLVDPLEDRRAFKSLNSRN